MFIDSTKRYMLAYLNTDTWTGIANEADAIGFQIRLLLNDRNCNKPKRAQAISKKLSDYFVLTTTGKKVTERTKIIQCVPEISLHA